MVMVRPRSTLTTVRVRERVKERFGTEGNKKNRRRRSHFGVMMLSERP